MTQHIYYRIEMQLVSPLSVGGGMNTKTDHDIVRGKDGRPYIPAASIAGVFRHTLDDNKALQNTIFGSITENKQNSKVIFYDGILSAAGNSSVRDSVKLKNKVGVDGAKFDMEVIETGAKFTTYIEIPKQAENIDIYIEKMIEGLNNSVLRFGAKTSRGYGAVKVLSLKKVKFDFNNKADIDLWIDFDLYDEKEWSNINEYAVSDALDGYIRINLEIMQNGAVSIREYSTDVGRNGETLPDYKHIALSNGKSVIPGTSWAGAIRSRFCEFAGEAARDALFGYVIEKKKDDKESESNKELTQKSRIIFSESIISDNTTKTMTRNSIDRFSSATKETALYTERTCYNGRTNLEIFLKDDATDKEKAVLGAVLLDLHNGFLSVGGLTSVGRGMFHITDLSVNGKSKMDELKSNNAVMLLEVKE